jgi:hypothetical protein
VCLGTSGCELIKVSGLPKLQPRVTVGAILFFPLSIAFTHQSYLYTLGLRRN